MGHLKCNLHGVIEYFFPESVKVVRMELETILDKEKELDVEIDRAVRWMYRFYERRDGMGLVISQSIQKWKWVGYSLIR